MSARRDPSPDAQPPQLDTALTAPLCFKAAGITEAALEGTVHVGQYDPERFMGECQANVEGPQADAWETYYLCIVTWRKVTPDCAKLSPPPPGLEAPAAPAAPTR